MTRPNLAWHELRFPRSLDEQAAVAALAAFSGLPHRARVVLDLSATSSGIAHHLAVTPTHQDSIEASLRAAIPSLRLTPSEPPARSGRRALVQLSPYVASLRTDNLDAISSSLLASLFPLRKGELVRLRWNLRSAPRPAANISGDNELRGGRLKALRAKLALPGISAYGELFVVAKSGGRRTQLVQRVGSVLRSLGTPYGRVVIEPVWFGLLARAFFLRGRFFSAAELAAVSGLPLDAPDLPGLDLGAAKRLVPSAALPRRGRLLGVSDFPGFDRPVALSPTASTRGLMILGPTGTGKSSMLRNLIRSDLEQGRGLVAIDIGGDLIPDVMDAVPPGRRGDVVVMDATDKAYAVGLNPFASSAEPSLVADHLGELFYRLWSSSWGVRTAAISHMGLLTLARRKGSTLLDLRRLLVDERFRATVLKDVDDPIGLGPDWAWFDSLSEAERAAVIAPLLNKCRVWASRPAIRNIVGQAKPALSVRQIVETRKVLLVHLPQGLVGSDTARLLGCLVLTSVWQALAERAALPVSQRHPFGIYVDEVQSLAAAPIPWDELSAQGRKYGAALVVANQALDQLPKDFREVLLANSRSKAVFALSASDARVMERHFAPALSAEDLQALDAYAVAAIVALDDGSSARPVTLKTPGPPPSLGSFQAVRESSLRRYARPTTEIETGLRSAAGPKKPSAPVGRKKRSPS